MYFFAYKRVRLFPYILFRRSLANFPLPLLPVAVYGFFDCITFHFFVVEFL